mgnify:FL=1
MILQAQISPPAGGGSFGLADTSRLENPYREPMWIDEIRFRLPAAEAGGTQASAWSSLRCELKLGETPLTKGFVPIGLFGKALNDSIEGASGGPPMFTWKLPKPLYVPARELLRPTIYYDSFTSAPAKTVNIIYCCRPVLKGTPPPRVLQIPWVTHFQPAFLALTGAAAANDQTDQSTPADLYNPWDQELHVQRFVGRLMGRNTSGEAHTSMSIASANINLTTGILTSGTLVSAQDSFNNILIRDRTPFAHVFDFLDRAWTVNCVLPPKGFYLFTVDRLWAAYTKTITATVGISMVGWREVRVQR